MKYRVKVSTKASMLELSAREESRPEGKREIIDQPFGIDPEFPSIVEDGNAVRR